jgi:hypothetical protein
LPKQLKHEARSNSAQQMSELSGGGFTGKLTLVLYNCPRNICIHAAHPKAVHLSGCPQPGGECSHTGEVCKGCGVRLVGRQARAENWLLQKLSPQPRGQLRLWWCRRR